LKGQEKRALRRKAKGKNEDLEYRVNNHVFTKMGDRLNKYGNLGKFVLICILIFMSYVLLTQNSWVSAEVFNISLSNEFSETEAGWTHLLIGNVTDSSGVCHRDNVTFTVTGVDFEYSNATGLYYGTVTQNTPQTIEYGVLGVFADTENVTSSGVIVQNTTVTWTTGTMDRLQQDFATGNWIGAILNEQAYVIGALAANTFIVGAFSIAAWQVFGVYGTFLTWFLGWGFFAPRVHGNAQVLALLLFASGIGVMIAKIYLDRRTS